VKLVTLALIYYTSMNIKQGCSLVATPPPLFQGENAFPLYPLFTKIVVLSLQ